MVDNTAYSGQQIITEVCHRTADNNSGRIVEIHQGREYGADPLACYPHAAYGACIAGLGQSDHVPGGSDV
jgi:hypothetical protein